MRPVSSPPWVLTMFLSIAPAWTQPAAVRKDALYFILDQLEAFDDGGEDEKAAPNERKRAQQLDAVASYVAHTLTNGPVPLDKIQVQVRRRRPVPVWWRAPRRCRAQPP